ncbi:oxidoreductase [Candidatus Zixiibacteriota bacterium]
MWSERDIPDLSGRNAIVTGANTGIGLETARALAQKGASVVMACRNLEKGNAAAEEIRRRVPGIGDGIVVMELDLSDLASVKRFVEAYTSRHNTLDILCNNAGVMMLPERQETTDGFEMQFGTNHFGHFALTGLLFDLLRQTPGARVVTVSSTGHRFGKIDFENLNAERSYHPTWTYGASKLANLLFTYELQRRLERAGIDMTATAAHPGWTATDLQRHAGALRFMNIFMAQKPPMGALPTLFAAISGDIRGGEYAGPRGFMEQRGYPKKVKSSAASHDEEIARRLWEISEELTGVHFPF